MHSTLRLKKTEPTMLASTPANINGGFGASTSSTQSSAGGLAPPPPPSWSCESSCGALSAKLMKATRGLAGSALAAGVAGAPEAALKLPRQLMPSSRFMPRSQVEEASWASMGEQLPASDVDSRGRSERRGCMGLTFDPGCWLCCCCCCMLTESSLALELEYLELMDSSEWLIRVCDCDCSKRCFGCDEREARAFFSHNFLAC